MLLRKENRAQTGKGLPSGPWWVTDCVSGPGWKGGATRVLRNVATYYLGLVPVADSSQTRGILGAGRSGRPPANGPANGPGP